MEITEAKIHGIIWKIGDHLKDYGVVTGIQHEGGWWYVYFKNEYGVWRVSMDDKKVKVGP